MTTKIIAVKVEFGKVSKLRVPGGCTGFIYDIYAPTSEMAIKIALDETRQWLHANSIPYTQLFGADMSPQ